jgi:hypothetical protein
MRSTELQELEAMAAKLLTAARKLPPGPERHSIFKEIGRFRGRIFALQRSISQQASAALLRCYPAVRRDPDGRDPDGQAALYEPDHHAGTSSASWVYPCGGETRSESRGRG